MSEISEIEIAIEKLPAAEVEKLAVWFEAFRSKRAVCSSAEDWLRSARGAANTGLTTDEIMSLTRGED